VDVAQEFDYVVILFGNRQCEEWALIRGECPVGEVKVAGYDNETQIFCAICGGVVDVYENTCTIEGALYDAEAYYHQEPQLLDKL
jgi:hypothetical protein